LKGNEKTSAGVSIKRQGAGRKGWGKKVGWGRGGGTGKNGGRGGTVIGAGDTSAKGLKRASEGLISGKNGAGERRNSDDRASKRFHVRPSRGKTTLGRRKN